MTEVARGTSYPPPVGATVVSRDRQLIGSVSETAADAFRVDAPKTRDYWLSNSLIASMDAGTVNLSFDAEQAEDFRMSEPVEARAESPVLDAQLDALPTAGERIETRRAMESGGATATGADHSLQENVDESQPAYLRPGTGGSGAPD